MTDNNENGVEGQPVADNTEGPVEFGTPTDATNPEPTQDEPAENPARPEVTNDPHPVDEDPEQHIGDEVPDPWGPPTTNFTDAGE